MSVLLPVAQPGRLVLGAARRSEACDLVRLEGREVIIGHRPEEGGDTAGTRTILPGC